MSGTHRLSVQTKDPTINLKDLITLGVAGRVEMTRLVLTSVLFGRLCGGACAMSTQSPSCILQCGSVFPANMWSGRTYIYGNGPDAPDR